MFCNYNDLFTESDVEQKLLWPLLTSATPIGLGFVGSDVLTKANTRKLEIGKGATRKVYFPDYLVVLAGLPTLVVEAKSPHEDIEEGLRDGRLYAAEVNAGFPAAVNPCTRIIACNGRVLASCPSDVATPDFAIAFEDLTSSNPDYARLVELCQKSTLQAAVDALRRRLRRASHSRAVSLLGGPTVQNEELPSNTFGATIAGEYGHIFSPQSKQDRARVARSAYVNSLRRQRYVEPIDRLIRAAVSPGVSAVPPLENTGSPRELTDALLERKKLENQVLLLIGSVGSGKSTFIDRVSLVALPEELRSKTVWARVNLNEAPLTPEVAYTWIADAIAGELRGELGTSDPDALLTLEKIFAPELLKLRRGALALLDPESTEYRARLADALIRLQEDPISYAKCLARFVCAGPGKLLVIVLDNCDKRSRDEQLFMFQVAQWVQTEFRALVVLPLRDVTYERHRHEPPLDTALKGLIFRIEPPPFTDVLQARVRLALEEMHAQSSNSGTLSYVLPNGIRVTYPASDQALYLASILKSLYEHDRFVRRIMTGLAGRDVRKALEIFLGFCTSGHIGEDQIYKIRFFQGKHVLPLPVVARVLLRMQRRFFDGDKAYIKNIVQCDPSDPLPDHFVRLSILQWLERRHRKQGPAGAIGFHQAATVINDLTQLGHDGDRVRKEILYLGREGCLIPEHLRVDRIDDNDLIKITAAGFVHLQLMASPDYLAACSEDTWIGDPSLAQKIAARIGARNRQYSSLTTAKNATDFVDYLRFQTQQTLRSPETYLDRAVLTELTPLRDAEAAIGASEIEVSKHLFVGNLPLDATEAAVRIAFEAAGIGLTNVSLPPPKGGQQRRFAFVEVSDGRSAMEALDSAEISLDGRTLTINEAHEPTARPVRRPHSQEPVVLSQRVFVGGLAPTATEQSVRELFAAHGFHAIDLYVPSDRVGSASRGYAFVTVVSEDVASQAIGALDGTLVDGRRINVKPATPRQERTD